MSDNKLVACGERHEMKYILEKYEKRRTNDNVDKMTGYCKKFKNDKAYQPHNRENFYSYLKDKSLLKNLE